MSDAKAPDWAGRLDRLARHCAEQPLDALVVSNPVNVRYLIGFTGSSGLLVSGPKGPAFITDGRYDASVREQVAAGTMAAVPVVRVELRYDLTLAKELAALGCSQVGVEAAHVTLATLRHWKNAAPGVEWHPVDEAVERMRLIKDAVEVDSLRRGGRMLSLVARSLAQWVGADRSERQVAADIDAALERAGFERPAFDTIVASGPNSAYPHAHPTDRRLGQGDLVVLDFGGVLDGYCVDLTRMAGIGQVGSEADRLYTAVRDAQAAALGAVRAGIPASDVDRAARQVLEARGLGSAFLHGTGHGLGLEVHEGPRVSRPESGAAEVLQAGMVCTVEPGAYVEGIGGVRLEDDVLVTSEGSERLTDAPTELVVV